MSWPTRCIDGGEQIGHCVQGYAATSCPTQRIADLVAEHRLTGRGSVTFGEAGSSVALTPKARLVLYRAGGGLQTTR